VLDNVVFLDLETTGGSPHCDRIIDVGLIEVRGGTLVGEWSTLVNPGRRVPHGIQNLTGITDEMLAEAPSFEALAPALAERLRGKVLAAHNARFDYTFLRHEFRRAGVRYTAPVLCTVKLSRRLFPRERRHNLDALIARHSLFCIDRHRGLGDARVLWELAQIWRRDPGAEALERACAGLLNGPVVPPGLPHDVFDDVPETPGVYIFYGDADATLHVGRAANLHARVTAHFGKGARTKDRELASAVRRIDCIETAGELGAYFRAARLTQELAPRYARRPADEHTLCAWRWRPDTPGTAPRLVAADDFDAASVTDLYGVFRSRASALAALRGLADAYRLCRARLGLERAEEGAPCSARVAGRCRGACVGAESDLAHAMRLARAFAGLRVRPWPYAGPIGVREYDPGTRRRELHVVDRWRYLGTADSDAALHELAHARVRAVFNLDDYRMLARFLKSPPASCEIVNLGSGPVVEPAGEIGA
jgi:DNA polymerase-3 subunit epsilon